MIKKIKQKDKKKIIKDEDGLDSMEIHYLFNELMSNFITWKLSSPSKANYVKLSLNDARRKVFELFMFDLLKRRPRLTESFKNYIDFHYGRVLEETKKVAHIDEKMFPKECPFSFEEVLSDKTFPGEIEGTE